MKQTIQILLFCFIYGFCHCQDNQLSFEASVTIDNVNNLRGGIKRGSSLLGLIDINLDYQPDKKIIKNTEFFTHLLKTSGQPASENFIGDAQVVSNIEGKATLLFYEIWIKQKLGNFSVLAGMHDMNREFFVSDYAGTFINSSFGISPGLSLNMPVSIYPVTTLATIVSFEKEQFTLVSGFYNLNHEFAGDERFHFHNHVFEHGFLSINELQYRWMESGEIKTELKTGYFFKQCDEDSHGDDEICISEKNYGAYLVADRLVYRTADNEKAINAFLQFNLSPMKYSYASEYLGTGITLNGFFSEKHAGIIGFALARVKLNKLNGQGYFSSGTYETALELNYKQFILPGITVQPDIQYIFNPGGELPGAFTCILRLVAELP